MAQAYSDPSRETDPHALPDIEVFEMTAAEVAVSGNYEDEIFELMKQPRYRLAGMNSRDRERLIDALIAQEGITGGWYWWSCFPGCLPDGEPMGPFATQAEALADAQEGNE